MHAVPMQLRELRLFVDFCERNLVSVPRLCYVGACTINPF